MKPMAVVGRKHQALSTVATPVNLEAESPLALLALAERMITTCRVKGGMALAAPQVGVSKRMVVLWDGTIWVNPRVEVDEDDALVEDTEACLSLPGRVYRVTRPGRCALTVSDLTGVEVTVDLEGLEARMIQHEVDHLDGVLISERGVEIPNAGTAMRF